MGHRAPTNEVAQLKEERVCVEERRQRLSELEQPDVVAEKIDQRLDQLRGQSSV